MCGLLFVKRKKHGSARFDAALAKLTHRGPDAGGSASIDDDWYLGHRRLKVIDLDARSDQPFWDPSGRYAILFNGEIYNFADLTRKYRLQQRTTSDTEVLLLLYLQLGASMLDELNGMFALVILDRVTGDYFVARDRLGVKPLYFYEDANWLIYASEIPPILEIVGKLPPSIEGMREYRVLRTFFNGHTAYAGIEMFPAGHVAINGRRRRYWGLPAGHQAPPGDDELRDLIEDAVRLRTTADVPVGSFLSGGLDSTIVAALSNKPDTWTVGFADMNEFEWADLAAQHIGSHHVSIEIDSSRFFRALAELTRLRQEPLSVPNEVSLYLLAREIKKRNTVTLSGEGADELFWGYDRLFRWAHENPVFDIREFARRYAYSDPADDIEIVESVVEPFRDRGSALDIVAAFFQVAHLHGLLRRLDASTMAASIEARPPFCDFRLVERLAGTPMRYRMAGGAVKAPLKRVFGDLVPAAIVNREKVGFPLPLDRLFPSGDASPATSRWLRYCEAEFNRLGTFS